VTLRCGACRTTLALADVVACATAAPWPEQQVVAFPCPHCRAEGHARLRDGLAEIVVPSGPGLFAVVGAAVEPELAAVGSPKGVEVWYAGSHRRVVARSPGWRPPQRRKDPASSA
jgi:hypothetical protein